jgi:hypothetical protein
LEGVFKWYDGGGENGITSRNISEVEVFFSYENIDFHFYLETLEAFFTLFSLFLSFSFFFFYDPSLEDLGVLMIFEEKITSSKTSFQMA